MQPSKLHRFGLTIALLALASCSIPQATPDPIAFIGTYTDGDSQGIYAYRLNPNTGTLTDLGLAAESDNPSFLAIDPNLPVLYAVNELSDYEGEMSGAVTAFTIDYETGKLARLNQVSTHGAHPAHLAVDRSGQWLIAANYTGGSVAVFPINFTGSLDESSQLVRHIGSGPDPRQRSPHAHSITVSEDNRYVFVSDLGVDRVYIYRFNGVTGQLSPSIPAYLETAPGAGPRHLTFMQATNNFYGVNEIDSTVNVYDLNGESGELTSTQTISTLPEDIANEVRAANTTAEIVVTATHVYASNRGHNSIAIFSINPADGTLTAQGHVPTQGATPRSFTIDPSGNFLYVANQNSSNIVTFAIDRTTGDLSPTGQVLNVPNPVSILFATTPEPSQENPTE